MIVVISLCAGEKINLHPCITVSWHDFRGGTDSCKSGKEYLNGQTC